MYAYIIIIMLAGYAAGYAVCILHSHCREHCRKDQFSISFGWNITSSIVYNPGYYIILNVGMTVHSPGDRDRAQNSKRLRD